MIGRALGLASPEFSKLRIVSATRLPESAFWKSSALAQSLSGWRHDSRLIFDIAFENTASLPSVYNVALAVAAADECVLFVHDDVWFQDSLWLEKVRAALKRFDVVGVAGTRRRVKGQPAWLYSKVCLETGQAVLDRDYLSGAVAQGAHPATAQAVVYGPAPASCELLDGVFIAFLAGRVRRSSVKFDERFSFHHYDLDFCRRARASGLSVGTWPIDLVHQSGGAIDESWRRSRDLYLKKWGELTLAT